MKSAKKMLNLKKQWKNPFGNGTAAEKILKVIKS